MGDEAFALEEAPAVPASMLSSAWGALLSMGGLVLLLGSLGYAVVTMSAYESEIDQLRTALAGTDTAPTVEASPEPQAAPSEAPSAPPTVVVTETVAATPAPAPTRRPAAGAASVDQVRQLQAQMISLRQQLEQAQAERDQARKDAANAQQCQLKLGDAQQLLERLRTVCRAASAISPPATTRPQ